MRKRKRTLQILAATLLAIGVLFMLWAPRKATGDEARYKEWHKPRPSHYCVQFLVRHLPNSVSGVLHLPALQMKHGAAEQEIRDGLLSSGYLTRVQIAVTNPRGNSRQICDRLWKATRKSRPKWEITVPQSNSEVVLTCRPQDVILCTRAIEKN
jgi:hypothetical protein